MSLFLRKSLRFGPVRFNLSKSGIGVSAGVKGLRIGKGPRGNYVYAGREGIYYRKTLGGSRVRPTPPATVPASSPPALDTMSPADAMLLVDETAAGLLAELNQKRRKWRIWPAIAVMFALTTSLFCTALLAGKPFEQVWTLALVAFLLGLLSVIAARKDRLRTTTVLFYNLEGAILTAFESLHSALEELEKCSKLSLIAGTEHYSDRRYHAGVNTGVDRKVIQIKTRPAPLIKTNIPVFALFIGNQTLYFFPDRLLVFDRTGVGAISYSDLLLSVSQCRFVESETLPRDAEVVGSTWLYVNNDGGPDLRFRHNRKIPVALYDELSFYTASGFHHLLQVSKPGIASRLTASIEGLDDALNVDAGPRETGVWFDVDKETAPEFALRIASIENRRFKKKYARLSFDAAKSSVSDQISPEVHQKVLIEAMLGTILLDWKGFNVRKDPTGTGPSMHLSPGTGDPLAYSEHYGREVLSKSEVIRNFVSEKARQIENFA
jgi:hypothetical protein